MRVILEGLEYPVAGADHECVAFAIGGARFQLSPCDAENLGTALVNAAAAARANFVDPLGYVQFVPSRISDLDLSDAPK